MIPTIDSCPDCVYSYTTDVWYYSGSNQTTLSSNQYKENYEDVIRETGLYVFFGLKLNESGRIEKAYSCGVRNGEAFCLEGSMDGSTYDANKTLLQSERLFGSGSNCSYNTNDNFPATFQCYTNENSSVGAKIAYNYGYTDTRYSNDADNRLYLCQTDSGYLYCMKY